MLGFIKEFLRNNYLILIFLAIYLLTIATFALIYFLYEPSTHGNFGKALYFSIVTITTLGYGEITPSTELIQIFASIEPILGIIIPGLLLNMVWQKYTDKAQQKQEEALLHSQNIAELGRLKSYIPYFQKILDKYILSISEITTPIEHRSSSTTLDYSFQYSDMRDIMEMTSIIQGGLFKSSIEAHYERQLSLQAEAKYLMANFDLNKHAPLHSAIYCLLVELEEWDVRQPLLSFARQKDPKLNKFFQETIKKTQQDPDLTKHTQTNLLIPFEALYYSLKRQITYLRIITNELNRLLELRTEN